MALIYKATVIPSKLALLTAWLPSRSWYPGGSSVRRLDAYRLDDPAGEVGIEALILQSVDGSVLHVPLTYRAAALAGADAFLVGTTEHSVLGTRWVYDACGDPIWANALATTVLTGGTQAAQFVNVDGRLEPRQSTATVTGSGTPGTPVSQIDAMTCHDEGPTTTIRADAIELVVVRVVGADVSAPHTLRGSWAGGGPAVLAGVRPL